MAGPGTRGVVRDPKERNGTRWLGVRVAAAVPLVLCASLAAAPSAEAQGRLPGVRPGDERPELPPFRPREREPGRILPPLERPPEETAEGMAAGARLHVRGYRIVGNTVLSEAELARITRPYESRPVSYADLETLRDELTLALVRRGYVTSGAVVPQQAVRDGIVEIRIVEGTLAAIDIETDGRLRDRYLESRVARAARGPVNLHELERRLQILQQDRNVERIEAALVPTEVRGESRLRLRVEEETPWRVSFRANNHQTPAIGAERGQVTLGLANLTGLGDALSAAYTGSEGLQRVEASWRVPLTRFDTELELFTDLSWSEIVEDPFDALDIESRVQTYGATLRQPVHRTLRSTLALFVTGEWRRSESFLLGEGFPFAPGVSDEGVIEVAVLRSGLAWTWRSRRQVVAARSTVSTGLDVLGATDNEGNLPDGQFVTWLGQLQVAQRLPWRGAQVVARGDVQVTNDPLPGIEQFAVGGVYSVRGYRENTLVRDNGMAGSLELRVPILPRREAAPWLEAGPFVDAGWSWSEDGPTAGPTTLVGVGVHAIANLGERVRLEVAWAEDLLDVPRFGDWNLQDEGLHLGITVSLP